MDENQIHADVKLAIDNLILTADRHRVFVGGFLFGADPNMLYNFGNCVEAKKASFYERLVEIADHRRQGGRILYLKPVKPS